MHTDEITLVDSSVHRVTARGASANTGLVFLSYLLKPT